jgi:hypothetical protein
MNNKLKEILDDMRKITILTGEISKIHEQSLKKWPYIVFDNLKDVEINYDLTKNRYQDSGANLVEFYLFMPKEFENTALIENFTERCEALKEWVVDMFWSDIETRIYVNGLLKYEHNKR